MLDHFVPNKDIKAARAVQDAAGSLPGEHGIEHFLRRGQNGHRARRCCPSRALVAPGDCIIGADSHTCTYGALGAFSTGVGSTDMAAGMATGKAWFKVPSAIQFNLTGKLPAGWVSGKDVILHIIGMIGVDGALYKSHGVYGGEGAAQPFHGRPAVASANMAIEAGAKNGIFPVDDVTLAYVKGRASAPLRRV